MYKGVRSDMSMRAGECRTGISGMTTYFSVTANECTHAGAIVPPRHRTLPITSRLLLPAVILAKR